MMHMGEHLALTIPSIIATLGTGGAWFVTRKDRGPSFHRTNAVARGLLPAVLVAGTCAGTSAASTGEYMDYLDHLAPTSANVTVHTQREDLLTLDQIAPSDTKLSTSTVNGKKVDPSKTYLASGQRSDYYAYVTNSNQGGVFLMNFKNKVDVEQFGIVGKKSGKPLAMETSGDTIKIIRDLDPKGKTAPYYESRSCSWKNGDVTKSCPINSREIHLYAGSVDYPTIVTDNPWNTNDDVTDPLVAKQANVADQSSVTPDQIQAGQNYKNSSN